ncbi:membrane bound O-acyl transferase MBOAT family protein [Paenibacillus sp. TCA20]|uniref:MBOAT family O-acyltransferase n=1 Tax=Paenibacillus sp. TCA20 TaxID=1499968 RepID=UPI0004D69F12|nr:MBOAT family O-acyltransferase [Paenibacillus sp. TCA20]GAK40164.1 membrane bound O-acyl transferase MBOAT family protein [Paenibacillus sp. TCA20]
MMYTDWLYWLFVLAAIVLYYISPHRIRPLVLITAGISFYSYYAGFFVLLLLAEAIIAFLLIHSSLKRGKRWIYPATIMLIILVLGYFKYGSWLGSMVNSLFGFINEPSLPTVDDLILPLGISYFTFELIHYVIEKKRGNLPQHKPVGFLAFLFFFPTMVAGPIKQFQQFYPQLTAAFQWKNVRIGVLRIGIGLFKKLVLAASLDILAQPIYSPEGISGADTWTLWVSLIAYTFVIYFDFSGYSDIAIGTARLFGIVIPENFRNPYLARSIAEFWNRWHISLGSWLTRYVYFPLGGSRVSKARIYVNLMCTMTVSGMWHGAAWHFVVWGMFHGIMLCIHRFFIKEIKPLVRPVPVWLKPGTTLLAIGMTFFGVTLSRVFFVLPVSDGMDLMLRLFGLGS